MKTRKELTKSLPQVQILGDLKDVKNLVSAVNKKRSLVLFHDGDNDLFYLEIEDKIRKIRQKDIARLEKDYKLILFSFFPGLKKVDPIQDEDLKSREESKPETNTAGETAYKEQIAKKVKKGKKSQKGHPEKKEKKDKKDKKGKNVKPQAAPAPAQPVDPPLRPPSELTREIVELYDALPGSGCLLVGDKGKLFSPDDYGGKFLLKLNDDKEYIASEKHESLISIPQSIPKSPGHVKEWTDMIRGGPPAYSNFDIAAYLTEIILLGCIALRHGVRQRIEWDGPNAKAKNADVSHLVKRNYRKGWEV